MPTTAPTSSPFLWPLCPTVHAPLCSQRLFQSHYLTSSNPSRAPTPPAVQLLDLAGNLGSSEPAGSFTFPSEPQRIPFPLLLLSQRIMHLNPMQLSRPSPPLTPPRSLPWLWAPEPLTSQSSRVGSAPTATLLSRPLSPLSKSRAKMDPFNPSQLGWERMVALDL